MTMTYAYAMGIKQRFFHTHGNDYSVSYAHGEDEVCRKEYVFSDGAKWSEVTRPIRESVKLTVNDVPITMCADLFETVVSNTDSHVSMSYCEKP